MLIGETWLVFITSAYQRKPLWPLIFSWMRTQTHSPVHNHTHGYWCPNRNYADEEKVSGFNLNSSFPPRCFTNSFIHSNLFHLRQWLIAKAFGCKTNVWHTCIEMCTHSIHLLPDSSETPSFLTIISTAVFLTTEVAAFGYRKWRIMAPQCFKCCSYKMSTEKP